MLGFRINSNDKRLSGEIIGQFEGFSTTMIADALGRCHTMDNMRHWNGPDIRMIGTALTVKTVSGDNLMLHKALDVAEPGDVIVIEGGGYTGKAILGEIICRIGQTKGIAGYVVDGAVRDVEEIRQMNFPVFSKGVNPAGPLHEGPGQINVAVSCAGVSVSPGDLIMGDSNGVVVVPYELAVEVLKAARKIKIYEKETLSRIESGTLDRGWVDRTLREKGVIS